MFDPSLTRVSNGWGGDAAQPHIQTTHLDHPIPSDHSILSVFHGRFRRDLWVSSDLASAERDEPLPRARRFLPDDLAGAVHPRVTGSVDHRERDGRWSTHLLLKMALLGGAIHC